MRPARLHAPARTTKMVFAVLLRLVLLLVAAVLTTGCDKESKEPLRVLAAQSLIDAFTSIECAFERAHPGVRIELSTASSGQLRAQIEAGAPADVFASAAQHHMDLLDQQGLVVPGTRRDFASNRLVLVVPTGGKIATPAELAGTGVKHVAVGDWIHVPAGRYARQVLVRHGLLEALRPKIRLCQNVRQVLTYVAAGEVDAGFVYETDAVREQKRVRVVWTAPSGDHVAIRLPIAAVARSRRLTDARRFIAFVASPAGQAILSEHGFVVPPPKVDSRATAPSGAGSAARAEPGGATPR